MTGALARATTALFVPGNRPERFPKASQSGADVVIVDLEDAVAAGDKDRAREAVIASINQGLRAAIRINGLLQGGERDLRAIAQLDPRSRGNLEGVVLPKAEEAQEVELVATVVTGAPVMALVESAAGLAASATLAASPAVVRLGFGALDFGADVGSADRTVLDHARASLVITSRATRIAPPIDSPTPEFQHAETVRREALRSRTLGFGGQLCIHPSQVEIVAKAFLPTDDELAWARRVMATQARGVAVVDGAMVDRPVLLRAEAILRRYAAGSSAGRLDG